MESDFRYYSRRAAIETMAARRAVTTEARERRLHLAAVYSSKARAVAALPA